MRSYAGTTFNLAKNPQIGYRWVFARGFCPMGNSNTREAMSFDQACSCIHVNSTDCMIPCTKLAAWSLPDMDYALSVYRRHVLQTPSNIKPRPVHPDENTSHNTIRLHAPNRSCDTAFPIFRESQRPDNRQCDKSHRSRMNRYKRPFI